MKIMLDIVVMMYIASVLSGLIIGSVGVVIATSRIITLTLTILHSVLGGGLLAIYLNSVLNLNLPVPLISTLFAIALSILVGELVEKGLHEDSSIALAISIATTTTIFFGYLASRTSSMALSKAWALIAGSSALVTIEDLVKLSLTFSITLPVIYVFFGEFKYIAFDEDGAKAMGLNVRLYRYLLYSLAALSASILSSTIGILATHVVLAVPGVLIMKIFKKLSIFYSCIMTVLVMVVGYILAGIFNLPPSGGVGIMSLIAIAVGAFYGRS
ncbi:MAG: metal ABC transporter permease [Nitrososphaerota archaeon]